MFSRFYSSIQRHPVRALILVICLHPAIMVADTSILHRQAVSAPPATLASLSEQNEGAEIDQEIERYFSSMHNRSSREIDAERLERLFGEAQVADHGTEDAAEGEFQFSNQSNGDMFSHRVVSGDTIWNLSKKYNVTTDSIIQNNPELKTRPLYIGEEILISKRTTQEPTTTSQYVTNYYSVRPGDSLSVIARRHGVSLSALFRWNNMNSRTVIHPGQRIKIVSRRSGPPNGYTYASFFEWPIRGTITSGYGSRSNPFTRTRQYHRGIDIAAQVGTPFRAARDGIVILSGRMGGYGNCIFIRHTNGYVSVYAHNSRNLVKVGDVIKRNQVIGHVGRTGTATGPHLHFEVRKWRTPMNPIAALNMRELVPENRNSVAAR